MAITFLVYTDEPLVIDESHLDLMPYFSRLGFAHGLAFKGTCASGVIERPGFNCRAFNIEDEEHNYPNLYLLFLMEGWKEMLTDPKESKLIDEVRGIRQVLGGNKVRGIEEANGWIVEFDGGGDKLSKVFVKERRGAIKGV